MSDQLIEFNEEHFNNVTGFDILVPNQQSGRYFSKIPHYSRHIEHTARYCQIRNRDKLLDFINSEYEKITLGLLQKIIENNLTHADDGNSIRIIDNMIRFIIEEPPGRVENRRSRGNAAQVNEYWNVAAGAADGQYWRTAPATVTTSGSTAIGSTGDNQFVIRYVNTENANVTFSNITIESDRDIYAESDRDIHIDSNREESERVSSAIQTGFENAVGEPLSETTLRQVADTVERELTSSPEPPRSELTTIDQLLSVVHEVNSNVEPITEEEQG